jgi:hypothetical protein
MTDECILNENCRGKEKKKIEDSENVSQVWNIPPPTNELFLNFLLKKTDENDK